jgi:hypothetical protein
MYHANRDRVICLSRKGSAAMKRLFLLAALGGLILTTSAVPADAAPRNRNGSEATASSSQQRSQATRNRSASQGQKANRQSRSANKANRNRAPRSSTAAG